MPIHAFLKRLLSAALLVSAFLPMLARAQVPTLSVQDAFITEGNSGNVSGQVWVELSAPTGTPVTFKYVTASGTATAGSDFNSVALTTATIPAWASGAWLTLTVKGDTSVEPHETFQVNISNPTGATIADASGLVTIQNDDTTISISDVSIVEGNTAGKTATFVVTLAQPSVNQVHFRYSTSDGTAVSPDDYTAVNDVSGAFFAGQTSLNVTVFVKGDTVVEADETFFVNLSEPSLATIADAQGKATITNDDSGAPTLSINNANVIEGNSGTKTATFTVTLSTAQASAVSFNLGTQNQTATSGSDYVAKAASLSIPAGSTSATFDVVVNGDTEYESNETFLVNITNPVGAVTADAVGVGTITNDDLIPIALVNQGSWFGEGDDGPHNVPIVITLTRAADVDVSFDLHTADGTATAGSDYIALSLIGQVIPAGQTQKVIYVSVIGDQVKEAAEENFLVHITNAQNAAAPDAPASYVMADDDEGGPIVTVANASVTEGNTGTRTLDFPVTLSEAAAVPVTLWWSTSSGGTASYDDYVPVSSASLVIPAGSLTGTLSVTVKGDTLGEPDEWFSLFLDSAENATIPTGVPNPVGTILNDDGPEPPVLSVENLDIVEGNSGPHVVNFKVTLDKPAPSQASFKATTQNGSATAGQDFVALAGVTITVPAGATSVDVPVTIYGDTTLEGDEFFYLNISDATNAFIGHDSGMGALYSDDGAPTLLVDDISLVEGNSGTKNAVFTFTLSAAAPADVLFTALTNDGTATQLGADYQPVGVYDVVIPAGTLSKTVSVPVQGDTLPELDETFSINFSSIGASVGDGVAVATILDDDSGGLPLLSVGDISLSEGNSGTKNATFTVQLSSPAPSTVSFNAYTANTTAIGGVDYVALPSTAMTIAAGQSSKQVTVAINGDTTVESDESFVLYLENVVGAAVSQGFASAYILNDDTAGGPTVSISDVEVTEGNSQSKQATFTLTLSATQPNAVYIDLATANGTASAGSDYMLKTETGFRIPAGSISKQFSVPVYGDTTAEPDETFFVNLSNAVGVTIVDAQGVGTIKNDDGGGGAMPTISIGDVSITEGNSGTKTATFTASLSAPAAANVHFDVATTDGTASGNVDYMAYFASGVTIPAGQTSAVVAITINGDTTVEPNETFNVTLSNVSNATLADGTAVGTITNDDSAGGPTVSINDVSVVEGNSLTKTVSFTVTLSAAQTGPVYVDLATANGTATAGSDYQAKTTTSFRIPAGSTRWDPLESTCRHASLSIL